MLMHMLPFEALMIHGSSAETLLRSLFKGTSWSHSHLEAAGHWAAPLEQLRVKSPAQGHHSGDDEDLMSAAFCTSASCLFSSNLQASAALAANNLIQFIKIFNYQFRIWFHYLLWSSLCSLELFAKFLCSLACVLFIFSLASYLYSQQQMCHRYAAMKAIIVLLSVISFWNCSNTSASTSVFRCLSAV